MITLVRRGVQDRSVRRGGALDTATFSMIGAWSLVCVALVTAAIISFGPAAHVAVTSDVINDPSRALIEPSDRFALVAWIVLAALIGLISLALMRTQRPLRSARFRVWRSRINWALGVAAIMCVVTSVMWGTDPTGAWSGITIPEAVTGLVAATVVLWILVVTDARWRAGSLVIVGLTLALVIPAWLQIPGAVRDPGHFVYTVDEIASVAGGHFPLSDYAPQYSVLLPFLAAPVLRAAPVHATVLALLVLLALQLVALAAAVTLPVLVGGRRMAGPAMLVVLAPTFAMTNSGGSASTYFAGMPLRVVLPVVTILVAYLALRDRPTVDVRDPWRWVGLGAVAGAAALNNPDYGLPVYVAVIVTVVVAATGLRARSISVALLVVGGVVVFAAYGLLGTLVGRPVHWAVWLVFQRVFGAAGFLNVAMRPFGLHIAIVALFVAASAMGFVLVRVSVRRSASGAMYRQGLLLCLAGGWSLLCLPYMAGRSLPPTYVGGYAFSAGFVVACMLPLFRLAARVVRTNLGAEQQVGAALAVVALAATSATITMVGPPSMHLSPLSGAEDPWHYSVLVKQTAQVQALRPVGAGPDLASLIASGTVVQALPMSSLVALVDGFRSAAVSSSPEYVEASPVFAKSQCEQPWSADARYLLVRGFMVASLQAEPSCADYFEWPAAVSYAVPVAQGGPELPDAASTWVLLPRGSDRSAS